MTPETPDDYGVLQQRLGIRFTQPELLQRALTHRSFLAEDESATSNERLEFLGDSVLDLIIAEELYTRHKDWPEGELTKSKAAAVGERSLEKVARRWEIGCHMRVSRGEALSGGRERRALLADAVEAVIGAYYLDQGLEACRTFVLDQLAFILETIDRREHDMDFKTQLQEVCQGRFQTAPTYEVVEESGPPHDRTFVIAVRFDGRVLGTGEGKSKKEAEQQAAAMALQSPELRDATGE
jgi:ribonuclease-3